MKLLLNKISRCGTVMELRKLDKEIVAVGRAGGMKDFRPLQEAYIKRKREIVEGYTK